MGGRPGAPFGQFPPGQPGAPGQPPQPFGQPGFPGGQSPYGPGQFGPYPGAPAPAGRGKGVVIGLVALLVVGGLVATLVIVLGGSGGSSAATSGTMYNSDTGVTVPLFKGWRTNGSDQEALNPFPCPDSSNSSVTDSSSDSPSGSNFAERDAAASPAPSASGLPDGDDCGTAQVSVGALTSTSFSSLISTVKGRAATQAGARNVKLVMDKDVTLPDGAKAHVLRWTGQVDRAKTGYSGEDVVAQYLLVNKPSGREYPMVVCLTDAGKGPGTGFMDAIVSKTTIGKASRSDGSSDTPSDGSSDTPSDGSSPVPSGTTF